MTDDIRLWQSKPITGISDDKVRIDDKPVDLVNEPPHYKVTLPSGTEIECIDVIRALGLTSNYYRASAFKYIWRAGKKGSDADTLRDLEKTRKFVEYEIAELKERMNGTSKKNGV